LGAKRILAAPNAASAKRQALPWRKNEQGEAEKRTNELADCDKET
jgi:hypothetical protein